ncbi:MAG: universal stress protein [Pseudomonadota bacterium]|jgi:nucleotide-binding universal stress UspA family protein
MKMLFAADGSRFTKKALAFLVTHDSLAGPDLELLVLNVQPEVSPRVRAMAGAGMVYEWQKDEAMAVLDPIEKFLVRHKINYKCKWVAGSAAKQIVRFAEKEKVHMILMGTHGHGIVGRALLGSVSQRVVSDASVPVMLVK